MTGTPGNANIWAEADVYVSFDLDATLPATVEDPFGEGWSLVGLLNGEDGFTEGRDWDAEDHFAWGGLIVRTARRNFKLTRSFTARETNATTDRLRWPGSSDSQVRIPRPERVLLAMETRDGDLTRRVITSRYAEIVPDGDITENEGDVADVSFVATVYATADGELFSRMQTGDAPPPDPFLASFELLLEAG